jgi:hypothetical protein
MEGTMIRESGRNAPSGWVVLPILLILLAFALYAAATNAIEKEPVNVVGWILVGVVAAVCLGGFLSSTQRRPRAAALRLVPRHGASLGCAGRASSPKVDLAARAQSRAAA